MSKRFDNFTRPFQDSRIPFLLTEVVTNGSGETVDLICRFANAPAAELLASSPQALQSQRLCDICAPEALERLAPLSAVAFSGSAASFSYETVRGRKLTVTCYQPMYGLCACVLEERGSAAPVVRGPASDPLADGLPGGIALVEVGRGVRCVSADQRLCELSRYSRREFLNRFSADLSPLVCAEDWPGLLQCLLDAVRCSQPVEHEFRLLRKTGAPMWVSLRAVRTADGSPAVFRALILDIDRQRREQEQLAASLRQVEDLRTRFSRLFENTPGGSCLFRLPPEGGAELCTVSRSFCDRTGYTRPELQKRMGADTAWHVHPEDRPGFLAAVEALRAGEDFRQGTFRFQRKGGAYLRLAVSAVRQPQEEGAAMVFAVYTDVTGELAGAEELRWRAELSGLLARPGAVLFDYDPRSDSAHLERIGMDGQRLGQDITGYRRSLSASDSIHPDFRRTVLSELRSACIKPRRGSFSYLGRYDDGGYRWREAILVSLADSEGNVCRVIGQSEDVESRRAAGARYRRAADQWSAQAAGAAAAVQLDLSADLPLSARGKNGGVLRALFGATSGECLGHLCAAVPEGADRDRFGALFSRDALLAAYRNGEERLSLEHLLAAEQQPLRVRTDAVLAENPGTDRTEVFLLVEEL